MPARARRAHVQRLLRVVMHHLQPARANSAHRGANAHLVGQALRQSRLEQLHLVEVLLAR